MQDATGLCKRGTDKSIIPGNKGAEVEKRGISEKTLQLIGGAYLQFQEGGGIVKRKTHIAGGGGWRDLHFSGNKKRSLPSLKKK